MVEQLVLEVGPERFILGAGKQDFLDPKQMIQARKFVPGQLEKSSLRCSRLCIDFDPKVTCKPVELPDISRTFTFS